MGSVSHQISPLADEILGILGDRSLSFKEFMELALYDPQHGYYNSSAAPGRTGDFFTSVSVGNCFGELLAVYLHQSWEGKGCPASFVVIEQGGHAGTLAADILDSLYANFPALYKCFRLIAIERSRHAMSDPRLSKHACWKCDADLGAVKGGSVDLVFANELLDAFAVHRVTWRGPDVGWEEVYVTAGVEDPSLRLGHGPITSPEVHRHLDQIDISDFGPGYTTEVNTGVSPWLGSVKRALAPNGKVLVIDYGLSAEAYHAASRSDGTLQAYHQHQRVEDALALPGEQDLTAHVNFTELETSAAEIGLRVSRFEEQHRFLTTLARGPLLAMEKRLAGAAPDEAAMKWVRQFQQLLSMGPTFKVMELTNSVTST